MSDQEETGKTKLENHKGSAEGVFYYGYAASYMDDMGEIVLVARDLNELIQRWYSISNYLQLDIDKIKAVAIFRRDDAKPTDSSEPIVKTDADE
jgi:hypothetical protein